MAAVTGFLRLIGAAYFLYVGTRKVVGATTWVTIFEQIGAGQWFPYLTGLMQIGGAVLLLIPRTFLLGAGVLACTMVGAILAWLFVIREPRSAILPAVSLTILAVITAVVRRFSRAGAHPG